MYCMIGLFLFFVFKQKTAYEMRISDWSSDVCSSDLMVDLATWNLSIPEGSPPKTIETPRLVDGFKNKYFNSEGQAVYFWAPVTGAKTENAIYPRSELRETYKDGTLRNWLYPDADNFLQEIGRASCRARECQYVSISVVAVT